MCKRRRFPALSILVLVGLLAICGYINSLIPWCGWGKLHFGICVQLAVEGKPIVGQPVTLRVETSTRTQDAYLTYVRIQVPPEVSIVDGPAEWETDLRDTGRSVKTVTLVVKEPGEAMVEVVASAYGRGYGTQQIYLLSSATGGAVSDRPSPDHWHPGNAGALLPMGSKDDRFGGTLEFSNQPALHETLSVTYTFTTAVALERAQITVMYPSRGFQRLSTRTPPGGTIHDYDGQITWDGPLASGQKIELAASLRITDIGQGFIAGFMAFGVLGYNNNIPTKGVVAAELKVNEYAGSLRFIPMSSPVTLTPSPSPSPPPASPRPPTPSAYPYPN
jgi:hypothetical protein